MTNLFIAAAVMFLIGGGFIGYAIKIFVQRRRTKSWAQTTGEILESNVEEAERIFKDPRPGRLSYFYPRVRYSYKVNLASYESTVMDNRNTPSEPALEKKVRDFAEQYSAGKTVTVYYDPEHPEKAVLNPNMPITDVVTLVIVGISLFICGSSFLMVYYVNSTL